MESADRRSCRVCGCTEDRACDDGGRGCHWVEADLCSACAKQEEEAPMETWDLMAIYDEQIRPLMTQIIDICKTHHLPMVAGFGVAGDEDGGALHTSTVLYSHRRAEPLEAVARYFNSQSEPLADPEPNEEA